ncbi:FAD:protein FMN transferase [SAR86 cluster bacterium]|nr:FAD:protein FMN transferase [SAR86 cluster bacterium]
MIQKTFPILILFILISVIALSLFLDDDEPQRIEGSIMGTTYNIIAFSEYDNLEQSIYDSFNSVNLSMSTYLNDSLINKVNYSDINEWVEVSQDFIEVLRYAVDTCIKSKGLYDVSIGKLVDSWGFGPLEKNQKPLPKDILYLKTQVGCDSIEINEETPAVKRTRDVALDFSSIAKGFAIDKVFKYLSSEMSIDNLFVELGGEIRTTKYKIDETPWKIGVVSPSKPDKIVYSFISSDYDSFAMATSGDYRNIRIFNKEEYSHTINPKVGAPNNSSKKSVSVVSNNAMIADALATALNVMELEAAMDYANEYQIKALFIYEQDGKSNLLFSKELQKVKM